MAETLSASVALMAPGDYGRIWSMAVTGPGRLAVIAGNRLVHIQVAEHVATS